MHATQRRRFIVQKWMRICEIQKETCAGICARKRDVNEKAGGYGVVLYVRHAVCITRALWRTQKAAETGLLRDIIRGMRLP